MTEASFLYNTLTLLDGILNKAKNVDCQEKNFEKVWQILKEQMFTTSKTFSFLITKVFFPSKDTNLILHLNVMYRLDLFNEELKCIVRFI